MNTNEIIRLLQDFQKLRIDLFKESQISALGKKLRTLYEVTEKEVRFQEIDNQISELNQSYYPNYFKEKLKKENLDKPKTKDIVVLEKYLNTIKPVYTKHKNNLKTSLTLLKKIQKAQNLESIQILLNCSEAELEDLDLITNYKVRKEVSFYKQSKPASSQNKKAETKLLSLISKIKTVRETGLDE